MLSNMQKCIDYKTTNNQTEDELSAKRSKVCQVTQQYFFNSRRRLLGKTAMHYMPNPKPYILYIIEFYIPSFIGKIKAMRLHPWHQIKHSNIFYYTKKVLYRYFVRFKSNTKKLV